jgi:hypothetical protein
MANPRLWNVVLHRHEDSTSTARVWVDGKLLLPGCIACSGHEALCYLGEALSDARRGDGLALRVQGRGGMRVFSTRDPSEAISWLAEQPRMVACSDAAAEGPQSGTRPIVSSAAAAMGAESKAS